MPVVLHQLTAPYLYLGLDPQARHTSKLSTISLKAYQLPIIYTPQIDPSNTLSPRTTSTTTKPKKENSLKPETLSHKSAGILHKLHGLPADSRETRDYSTYSLILTMSQSITRCRNSEFGWPLKNDPRGL